MSEIFKVNAKQAIRDGVKELKVWKSNRCEEHGYFEFVDGIPTYTPMIQVKDVLENGVKEMQPLPAQDGNRDWGLYYQRQKNLTKPHNEYVKEVIEDLYNHRGRVGQVISLPGGSKIYIIRLANQQIIASINIQPGNRNYILTGNDNGNVAVPLNSPAELLQALQQRGLAEIQNYLVNEYLGANPTHITEFKQLLRKHINEKNEQE